MVSPSTSRQKSIPLDLCPYALVFEAIDAANDVKVNVKDPGPYPITSRPCQVPPYDEWQEMFWGFVKVFMFVENANR